MINITVPTLGESVTEATVATWFKKPGDYVETDEMLCELETDKVTVEVPCTTNGILTQIVAPEGSTVGIESLLAIVDQKQIATTEQKTLPTSTLTEDPTEKPFKEQNKDIENAPSANKLMHEKNIDGNNIVGSGRDGRIMKEDVLEYSNKNTEHNVIKSNEGNSYMREERVKMTRLRQTISKRLKEAQNTAAMLTTYNEVDMTNILNIRSKYKEQFESKHKVKLGFMSFFAKACAHALFEVPEVNAEISENEIIYRNFVNMSVAVGTPTGLVAPVINNIDRLSFAQIEGHLFELGQKAKNGKLTIEEMQGGTFTISNGGVYGSLMSSPILNPPQSGILGMHKIQERPIALDGQVVIRPMMYLALSYDHRLVDGKGAVTFLVRVKDSLEDPNRILMDL
jgi:2-oxoglutarate dehydrogenase E2 component (dihydrolipoamide succinyltransferase)